MRDERALLVGINTGEEEDFEHSMEELGSLVEACDMEVVGMVTQSMATVHKALYIGSGKVIEVKEYAQSCEADIIVFDNGLSPTQIRNLSKELDLPIMDRTTLILEIFASRAKTREAKLQVETARLQYLLPRLVGMGKTLSRQGGASGSQSSKGAGEKKLELDRRRIEHRISELRKELRDMEADRETQRKKRSESRIPLVALVGYTNAGKSTVMNRMVTAYGGQVQKQVLEQDMLFATLDTSVRKIEAGDNKPFLLVDTVGFIHKLPHGLIKAFRSTLEEVKYADLLVQVIDYSDENYKQQMEVTAETLKELGAGDISMIYVYNKAEMHDQGESNSKELPRVKNDQIYMTAVDGIGITELTDLIKKQVYADNVDSSFLIPYEDGRVTSYFMEHATVLSKEYIEGGVLLHVNCHKQDEARFHSYKVSQQ